MYKLIRRISSSFFPRPDRPWGEDATSTAPQIGRKRRYSSTEPDDDESTSALKRHRLDTIDPEQDASRPEEGEGVKEVTKGVQGVEIEAGGKTTETTSDIPAVAAAAIPLPDSPVLEAQQESTEPVINDSPEEVITTQETVAENAEAELVVPSEKAVEEPVLVNGVHAEESEESTSAEPATEEATETATVSEKKGDVAVSTEEVIQKGELPTNIAMTDNAQDH